jgi:hypothetical protein
MHRAPSSSRPYIHWPLDRWKLGIALLLTLLLLITRGVGMPQTDPPPAEESAAQVEEPAPVALTPTLPPSASAQAEPTLPPGQIAFTMRLLGSGATFLSNSRPVLFGQTNPGQLISLQLDGARFQVTGDEAGSWQFVFPHALPLGMHWVRATTQNGEGVQTGGEMMLLIGPNARPIVPPTLDLPLPQPGEEGVPLLQGDAPLGETLVMVWEEAEGRTVLGPVTVDGEGRWQWQPSMPLEPGRYALRVVVVDVQGTALSQSPVGVVQVGPGEVSQNASRAAPAIDPPQPEQDDSPGQGTRITGLAGRATPGARLFLYINGQWEAEFPADAEGLWRYDFDPPLDAQGQQIQVVEVDEGGRPLALSLPIRLHRP